MPKIELHVHVEGTIKGELLFEMADRNGIELPHDSSDGILDLQNESKAGVLISLSTDDPAQFGSGRLTTTLTAAQTSGGFTDKEMTGFMENVGRSAWMTSSSRVQFLDALSAFSNLSAGG